MSKIYYLIICFLSFSVLSAQEKLSKEEKARREKNIQAGNPFTKYGSKAPVATLSKGKYLEVHDLDSIVTIGTSRWHVDNKKIVGDIIIDSLNVDAQPIGDRIGRWMSPDPLSEEFPSWSPYNMSFNNPIKFVDPDGRAPIDPNEYDFDITTGKTTLVSNKGGNTTDYVNYTRGEGENKETVWTETIPVENTVTNVQTNGEMNFGPFFERTPGKSNATFYNAKSGALSDPSADIFMSWAGGKIAGQLIGAAWKGISGLFATESAVATNTGVTILEGGVNSNFGRFVSKIPANSKTSASFELLEDGNYLFKATSPGKVPGSSALYQKWVNPQGETFKMLKTTFAPDGSIIHIKPKM